MEDNIYILSNHLIKLWQNLAYYLETVNRYRYEFDITQKQAWERVESELENAKLKPRYTSYESFCAGLYQFNNKSVRKI